MKGIAQALKYQRLRKQFPEGVSMKVVQTDMLVREVLSTDLKTGREFPISKHYGQNGMLGATKMMQEIAAGLKKAQVYVELPLGISF